MMVERLDDRNRSAEIARNMDALFANSSTETKTATESAFIQSFANQMGNIGALITGVAAACSSRCCWSRPTPWASRSASA